MTAHPSSQRHPAHHHRLCLAAALCVAIALADDTGTAAAQQVDPFVSGAQLGRLAWAESACGGRVVPAVRNRLEASRKLGQQDFDSGKSAAERALRSDIRAGSARAECAEVVRQFGPRGRDLKGAYVPPAK